MQVSHSHGTSIVTGKNSELSKIEKWIELANCEIMIDESEDGEVYLVVVSKSQHTTQKERQEDFQHAKKLAK